MSRIVGLPSNLIGKQDQAKLESFGGHTVAHGRATRWHWAKDDGDDDRFEIFRGGADEVLIACVGRDRREDVFWARDGAGRPIGEGTLEQMLARLDAYLSRLHGERG